MKRKIGLEEMLCMFLALTIARNVYAQTASFAELGVTPDAPAFSSSTAPTENFMSDDDMNFGADNDVGFGSDADNTFIPKIQPQSNMSGTQNNTSQNGNIAADTLTETLQQQEQQSLGGIKIPDVSDTWVNQLATSVPQAISSKNDDDNSTSDGTLNNLLDDSRSQSKRSNASVFDISGIMLRMNLAQADKAMMVRGFKRVSQKMEIPNFIKWRNEEACRNNGVVGYERLMNCVVEIAKKNNYQYVETAKYAKYSTKEEVEIKLTSNFTGNKIYRIMYRSMSGKVIGSGAKAAYLRNIKVFDFWKKVNQKYGNPDNKDEVTWGLGMNKPYMKASTGFLVLEDPMLRELDYTRMSREDQRFMNTDLYSF